MCIIVGKNQGSRGHVDRTVGRHCVLKDQFVWADKTKENTFSLDLLHMRYEQYAPLGENRKSILNAVNANISARRLCRKLEWYIILFIRISETNVQIGNYICKKFKKIFSYFCFCDSLITGFTI